MRRIFDRALPLNWLRYWMKLQLREADILCSVFAAGLQSIVMGTGVRVSRVMSHQTLILSPCLTVSHTSAVTRTSHHERDTRAQNIMEYVVTISSVFSSGPVLVPAGGGRGQELERTQQTLHNITQHYTANITQYNLIIEYKHWHTHMHSGNLSEKSFYQHENYSNFPVKESREI